MIEIDIIAAMSLLGDYADSFAWFPEAASSFSEDTDWLYDFITLVCLAFFLPIVGSLFYFAYKYHKPRGAKAESNVAHNTPIELAWSIGPSFFLVGMFVLGAKTFLDYRTVPDGANDVGVKAFKWGWTIDYGAGTYHPELHILLNEPTKLSMRSDDVIHSLFIPAFRAKKDIVPGRYNYMWFKPTVASEKVASDEELAAIKEQMKKDNVAAWDYDKHQFTPDGYSFFDLYCAEYCGTHHSQMQTVVVVHKELDDLEAWIKENSKRPEGMSLAEYGRLLYERRGCKGCHSLDGSRKTGPSFVDTFGNKNRVLSTGESIVIDKDYIRESVLNPRAKIVAGFQPVMPSYKGQLTDDDIDSIAEFLKSVSKHATSEEGEKDQDQDQSSDASDSQEAAAN